MDDTYKVINYSDGSKGYARQAPGTTVTMTVDHADVVSEVELTAEQFDGNTPTQSANIVSDMSDTMGVNMNTINAGQSK